MVVMLLMMTIMQMVLRHVDASSSCGQQPAPHTSANASLHLAVSAAPGISTVQLLPLQL